MSILNKKVIVKNDKGGEIHRGIVVEELNKIGSNELSFVRVYQPKKGDEGDSAPEYSEFFPSNMVSVINE